MSETWIIASERPRPPSVPIFHCGSCAHKRRLSKQHPSGYCDQCMTRGRRYWLNRWELAEIVEVASCFWPEDFVREEVAA